MDPSVFTLSRGEFLWTFVLLVAAMMIAALSVEEAGSKDNEGPVALVQKGSFRVYFLWPQIKATYWCLREHLNGRFILFVISHCKKK